jgi:hypothetical protein
MTVRCHYDYIIHNLLVFLVLAYGCMQHEMTPYLELLIDTIPIDE